MQNEQAVNQMQRQMAGIERSILSLGVQQVELLKREDEVRIQYEKLQLREDEIKKQLEAIQKLQDAEQRQQEAH